MKSSPKMNKESPPTAVMNAKKTRCPFAIERWTFDVGRWTFLLVFVP